MSVGTWTFGLVNKEEGGSIIVKSPTRRVAVISSSSGFSISFSFLHFLSFVFLPNWIFLREGPHSWKQFHFCVHMCSFSTSIHLLMDIYSDSISMRGGKVKGHIQGNEEESLWRINKNKACWKDTTVKLSVLILKKKKWKSSMHPSPFIAAI